jgi:hypothetical protein
MTRIVLGVIAGVLAWLIAWVGVEQLLSAIWPDGFGAHQQAFQAAIENGGPFTAETTPLLIHIVMGSIVSMVAGFVAAVVAGENRRAPVALGVVLIALGVMKAVLSWPYVPLWYSVIFTLVLYPLAIMGGKLKTAP